MRESLIVSFVRGVGDEGHETYVSMSKYFSLMKEKWKVKYENLRISTKHSVKSENHLLFLRELCKGWSIFDALWMVRSYEPVEWSNK